MFYTEYSLGCDLARMGQDSTVLIVAKKESNKEEIRVVYVEELHHTKLTEVVGKIKLLDMKYNFNKICLDSTGLGAGPGDMLVEDLGSDKVECVTFTVQSKEDMYSNLKKLMEQGRLKIPNIKKLIFQLADFRYEVMSSGHLKLHHSEGKYDDYTDALALSVWFWKTSEEEMYTPFFR